MSVSTHSRLKAAGCFGFFFRAAEGVSTHSRLKAAGWVEGRGDGEWLVSTHSRLKAAGCTRARNASSVSSFNTQPPEGGWKLGKYGRHDTRGFNTQPPEGGWPVGFDALPPGRVSTHSRLKAAGEGDCFRKNSETVSTHSRLKAAGFGHEPI